MPSQPISPVSEGAAGKLLSDLEPQQGVALRQLDDLDAKLREVLSGQGVTVEDEIAEERL